MKKVHYAWIEQVLSFDSDFEREVYLDRQRKLSDHRKQAMIHVIALGYDGERYTLRIRKPYNSSPMLTTE